MPTLKVGMRDGGEIEIDAEDGVSVMVAMRSARIEEIAALCGGTCSCATCHVYVDPAYLDRLEPMDRDEDDLLDSSENRSRESRLSCQLRLTRTLQGLRVTIAPED